MEIIKDIGIYNKYSASNNPEYIVVSSSINNKSARENSHVYKEEFLGYSNHYTVDGKEVIQSIEDEDSALHVQEGYLDGRWATDATTFNTISVHICLDNNYEVENETVDNLIDLVLELMERHNIQPDNVVRQFDCTGKNSPSCWRHNKWNEWWTFKGRIGSSKVSLTHFEDIIEEDNFEDEFSNTTLSGMDIFNDQIGTFTPNRRLPLYRLNEKDDGQIIDTYLEGESVIFDSVYTTDKHSFISYLSFDEDRRFLPINEIDEEGEVIESYGNIDPDDISNNIDTDDVIFDLGIVGTVESSGTFIADDYMRVRIKPTSNSSHVLTVKPGQVFNYDRIVIGNGYRWLSFINDDGIRWYVAFQSFESLTGSEGEIKGTLINDESSET